MYFPAILRYGAKLVCGLALTLAVQLSFAQDEPSIPPGSHALEFDPASAGLFGSVQNPDLVIGPCDELNIVVVLDESGSIDDDAAFPGFFSQNEQEVRAALLGLATELNNSGTELAVIQFSTESKIVDVDGVGPGLPGYREVNDDLISDLSEYLYPGGAAGPDDRRRGRRGGPG